MSVDYPDSVSVHVNKGKDEPLPDPQLFLRAASVVELDEAVLGHVVLSGY